ncbi:MAG: hypothetical protein HY738_08565 [Bacteroidia bacterium]|nr:hypothetical protein [Bacteroidia bacterium]
MKRTYTFFLLFLIAIICPLVLSAQKAELQDTIIHVPGTKVRMIPPKYFLPNEQIKGFIHQKSASTIQVNEIEGTAYPLIVDGMTDVHFASQNVELVSKEEINTDDGKHGMLYVVSFTVKEVKFERIMYFTGDYNNTIWVNANYPVLLKPLIYNTLRQSLLTVEFDTEDD